MDALKYLEVETQKIWISFKTYLNYAQTWIRKELILPIFAKVNIEHQKKERDEKEVFTLLRARMSHGFRYPDRLCGSQMI